MLVVKDLHHHEGHCPHAHTCVLDHMPIGTCAHPHASVIEYDHDEDDCAICHFTISKLFQPRLIITPVFSAPFRVLEEGEYHFPKSVFCALCSGRAPPRES